MTTTPSTVRSSADVRTGAPFRFARLASLAVVAAVANLALYGIGVLLGGAMTVVQAGVSTQIPWFLSALATLLPLLIAGGLVRLLARPLPVLLPVARWAGLALALLSIASPLLVATDLTSGLALAVMHVTAGIAWFLGLAPRTSR